MTKLDDYLNQPGISASELAARAECDPATISRLRRGATASLRTALAIERATGGVIRAADLLGKPS
jgi:DNA-binding transcriptional regulator YdaS (Cro superfamily)